MIYQKCKQCGNEWHGIERTHCPSCGAMMPEVLTMNEKILRKANAERHRLMIDGR